MINDIFLRRYPARLIFSDRVPPDFSKFFVQVAHIIFQDVTPHLLLDQNFFRTIHDALARELGVGWLFDGDRFDEVCGKFLTERFDLWIDRHGDPDKFVKMRLSLIELMFRGFEERTREKPPKEKIRAQEFIAGLMRLHANAVEQNLAITTSYGVPSQN